MSNVDTVKVAGLSGVIADQLNEGKEVSFVVTGVSMLPLFVGGRDSVVLSPIESIKRGKIVYYRRQNGDYVLHRVYRVKGDDIYVVGDNQTTLEKIHSSQVLGEVTSFVRKGINHTLKECWYKTYVFWVTRVLNSRGKLYKLMSKINRGKV